MGVGSGGVKSSIAGAEERGWRVGIVVVSGVEEDEGSGGIDGEGFGGACGEDVVPAMDQHIKLER